MKSMWISLWLTRSCSLLGDREGEAEAEREVADRVLVEQRVVEDRPERADAALAVDERELAEPGRAFVDLGARADRAAVLVGLDLDGAHRPRSARGARARSSRP